MLNKALPRRNMNILRSLKKSVNLNNIKTADELALADHSRNESPFPSNPALPQASTVSTARLSNGITLVAESPRQPSSVTMGVLLDVGSRDETGVTSGALHSMKTTFYKSFLRTNETINYGMLQMSGGKYEMNFTREHAIYRASCLSHDVVDIFTMMTDCALEPKNFVSSNAGASKLPHSHALAKASNSYSELTDKLMKACYGSRGLGNALLGEMSNIDNLNAYVMQQFQLKHIATENIVVAATGVECPEEFFELAELRLGGLNYNKNVEERVSAEFLENEVRNVRKGKVGAQFAVALEAGSWKDANLLDFFVICELLGRVEVNEYDPLNTQAGRFYNNVYSKNAFVDALEASNQHFTDSGLFVVRGETSSDKLNSTLDLVAKEFGSLGKVNEKELNAAKKRLKLRLLSANDCDSARLDEMLKQMSVYGQVDLGSALQKLNAVSTESIKQTVERLAKAKMSVVIETENLTNVYSHAQIKKLFG